MFIRLSVLSILIGVSTSAAFAGDALCDKVKDKAKRADCHCKSENGATVRANTADGKGVRWSGVPGRLAPAVSACMQKRGI